MVALVAAGGTTSTQEVDVSVVVPPPSNRSVKVKCTASEVVFVPFVIVCLADVVTLEDSDAITLVSPIGSQTDSCF